MEKFLSHLRKNSVDRRGFLLAEVLLSVAILSVSLVIIVQSLTASYRASSRARMHAQAALALENLTVEKIYQGGLRDAMQEEGEMDKPFERFRYQISASPATVVNRVNDRIQDVTFEVVWGEKSREQTLSLQTFLFNASRKSRNSDE